MQPASRAALYGLKASHGSIDTAGVLPGGSSFDCLGGFAKTPTDLANMMSILSRRGRDYTESLNSSWDGLEVGFVDTTLWQFPPRICEQNEEFRKQLVGPLLCRDGAGLIEASTGR